MFNFIIPTDGRLMTCAIFWEWPNRYERTMRPPNWLKHQMKIVNNGEQIDQIIEQWEESMKTNWWPFLAVRAQGRSDDLERMGPRMSLLPCLTCLSHWANIWLQICLRMCAYVYACVCVVGHHWVHSILLLSLHILSSGSTDRHDDDFTCSQNWKKTKMAQLWSLGLFSGHCQ